MSDDFAILFLGVTLGYILAELVSWQWAVAIVVLMLIVAVFYKPSKTPK